MEILSAGGEERRGPITTTPTLAHLVIHAPTQTESLGRWRRMVVMETGWTALINGRSMMLTAKLFKKPMIYDIDAYK